MVYDLVRTLRGESIQWSCQAVTRVVLTRSLGVVHCDIETHFHDDTGMHLPCKD